MSATEDLAQIASALRDIVNLSAFGLDNAEAADFKRLALEACAILDDEFNPLNSFSREIRQVVRTLHVNMGMSSSRDVAGGALPILDAAVNHLRRRKVLPRSHDAQSAPLAASYVNHVRLAAINAAPKHRWDLSRLAQLCHELNIAHAHECHMSVAMLVRTITDHIPPIFDCVSFSEVANNTPNDKSFKKSMKHLENSLRNIADNILHKQVRQHESLPNGTTVNFSADLDVLLQEVVRRTTAP